MSSSDVTGLLIGLLNAWAFSLQCAIQWARVTTVIHTHTHKIMCPLSRRASVHTDGGSYLKHTAHRSSLRCAYRKNPELFVFSVKVIIWFLWRFWFDVNS